MMEALEGCREELTVPMWSITRSWAREDFMRKPELEERVTRKAWREATDSERAKAPMRQSRIPEGQQRL